MPYFLFLLLILGSVLAIIEIFLPGFGVFGIAGIICIAVSSIYTIMYHPFGLMIVASELIALGIVVYAVIRWAKAKQLYGSIILRDILAPDKKEIEGLERLIGKDGITDVPLKQFGSVLFNGVKMDAYSDGQYIPKGRTVTVINVVNDRIIVKETN